MFDCYNNKTLTVFAESNANGTSKIKNISPNANIAINNGQNTYWKLNSHPAIGTAITLLESENDILGNWGTVSGFGAEAYTDVVDNTGNPNKMTATRTA
jgi:hypothetical protein